VPYEVVLADAEPEMP
jgi:hypothetical protein